MTILSPQAPAVLIVASPRSGIHLLEKLLLETYGIAFPLVTHGVPHFNDWAGLWGDVSRRENRAALLDALLRYERIRVHLYERSGMDPQAARDSSLVRIADQAEAIVDAAADSRELFNAAYTAYARSLDCPHWGYCPAFYDFVPVEKQYAPFGQVPVVHIVRDGRDAVLSWTREYFGPPNVVEGARLWRRHVTGYRAFGERNPGRYLEVRYEDLLKDTAAEVARVGTFLGLEPLAEPYGGDFPLLKAMASTGHHRKLGGAVDRANTSKWASAFSERDKLGFERAAGDALAAFGYPPTPVGAPASGIGLAAAWGRIAGTAQPTNILKQVRAVMPLALWAAKKLGL